MKTAAELRLEGKDPGRGRNYRKEPGGAAVVRCWQCANSRKRPAGGRIECALGAGIVGTLFTCDRAVKAK